jgi:hypothetical protein
MAILNNSNAISTAGGYDINNSLRFRRSASAYLNRTPASSGSQTTWTYSTWFKRGALGSDQILITAGATNNDTNCYITSSDKIYWFNRAGGTMNGIKETTQVFRDPSAWYHIILVWDTTQGTASNRMKIYVNGSQVTSFSSSTDPSSNTTSFWNSNVSNKIASDVSAGSNTLDGYLADVNFIDGQALTPSSFGETDTTTGVWKPKAYTGTYGTNGFYLKFSDIATTSGSNAGLGKDFSGNANYWTTNNISVTAGTTYDAMIDSPTLTSATVANYCVINSAAIGTDATVSGANLDIAYGASGTELATPTTIGMSSGKWYCEFTITAVNVSPARANVGITNKSSPNEIGAEVGINANGWGYYGASGNKYNNGTSTAYGSTYTTNDVIGIAFDADNGTLTFYKNGVSQGVAFSGLASGTYFFAFSSGSTANTYSGSANFGQRPFAYTPPTGFVRLNTFNLPTPTILAGNKYMDATLYVGNGVSQNVVTASGFKPDFVWIKDRTTAGQDNGLYDTVRGTGRTLYSNLTNAESSVISTLTAFNSNGYTVGTENMANKANDNFVGWSWQAGQGSTSSNTQGSITSTVSVSTTAGFSIVTYTGVGSSPKTVGHGLGVAPKMILLKSRGSAVNWYVWHTSLGATQVIEGLNTTGAASSQITFNNTLPTSSVISLGNNDSNNNGSTYVLYVWAEIAGFSKFGSYTGNGSADGPFVFTNLKPRFIMIKRTDTTSNWTILDTAREGYNVDNDPLYPNLSDAEGTTDLADILSNGFKLRSTDASVNANAGTYIYACFASNPFRNSNAT